MELPQTPTISKRAGSIWATSASEQAAMPWAGEPVFSRYDPPLMPWFLRRNEIWLNLS
jgi:hypothetical protein